MAYILMLWGTIYLIALIGMYVQTPPECYSLFRVKVLVTGNLYIAFTFFFPLQVLMPGWLNWKRIFLLLMPILVISGIYYVILSFYNMPLEEILSYADLGKSFSHFNVWYRFVILLCNFVYIVIILRWLYKQEKRYIKWKNDNYADQEYVDISWMRVYDILIFTIFVFYLLVLLLGGRISVICHSVIVMSSFSYLFYKALFYESPYPDDFFSKDKECEQTDCYEPVIAIARASGSLENTDMSFENRIQLYTTMLKEWMEKEKPYLFKDFKLTDVSRELPLNRSYLSRVFNEGFGCSFSEVVRNYRVIYSKELIRKSPKMPLNKIAELSGFSSDSTYIRAFKQVTGITPSQFKIQLTTERVSAASLEDTSGK